MIDFTRRRWAGLVFISIAVSLIIVDSTIVNVAIPSIVDDLGITSTQVQWVQEAYTLVFASLLLVFGSLADRFGRTADAPGRRRHLRRRVDRRGVRGDRRAAHRRPVRAGRRWRDDPAGDPVAAQRDVPRSRAHDRLRGLGIDDRRDGRGRPAPRRLADDGLLVAMGIRHQRPARHHHHRRRAAHGRRVAGPHGRSQSTSSGALLSVVTMGSLVFALIEGRSLGWWYSESQPSIGDWTWTWDISPIPFALAIAAVGAAAVRVVGRSAHPSRPFDADRLRPVPRAVVPQREHRRARGLPGRVRHHPRAAAVAAVRARAQRPADRAHPPRPRDRVVRGERLRRRDERTTRTRDDRARRPASPRSSASQPSAS